jgi:hypothetical protein
MKLAIGIKYSLSRQAQGELGIKETICKIISIQGTTVTIEINGQPITLNKEYALENLKEYRVLKRSETVETVSNIAPTIINTVSTDNDVVKVLDPSKVDMETGDIDGLLDEQTKIDNNIIDLDGDGIPDDVKEKIEEIKEEENGAKYQSGYGIDPKNPDFDFI